MPEKADRNEDPKTPESKLIPVLREGVDIVKIVLFKELKSHLAGGYPAMSEQQCAMVCGAIINELFATPNREPSFAAFVETHRAAVRKELEALHDTFEALRIPLTDALRIQFLCDDLEGVDSSGMLESARALGVLMVDRQVPLPRTFVDMARRLGVAHRILQPQSPPAADGD